MPNINVAIQNDGRRNMSAQGGPTVKACNGCHATNNRVESHAPQRGVSCVSHDSRTPRKTSSSSNAGTKNRMPAVNNNAVMSVTGLQTSHSAKNPSAATIASAGTAKRKAAIHCVASGQLFKAMSVCWKAIFTKWRYQSEPCSIAACSSGRVSRPSTALRCGKRPYLTMISRCALANLILFSMPKAVNSPSERV